MADVAVTRTLLSSTDMTTFLARGDQSGRMHANKNLLGGTNAASWWRTRPWVCCRRVTIWRWCWLAPATSKDIAALPVGSTCYVEVSARSRPARSDRGYAGFDTRLALARRRARRRLGRRPARG